MCFISSNALTVNWVYEIFTFINLTERNGGKFGLHCNQSCGFCLHKGQWHWINDTCLNWCDSGYKERDCKQGNCLTKVQITFFTKIMSQKPYQGIIEKKTGVFSNYYIMKMSNNPWLYISELFIYIFEKLISQIKQVIFP